VLWFLAWNHYREGNYPAAAQTFTKLIKEFPRSSLRSRAHYWLGRTHVHLGSLADALQAYRQALASEPLSYYGMMAQEQIKELQKAAQPAVFRGGSVWLASVLGLPGLPGNALENFGIVDDAEIVPLLPSSREIPWGDTTFHWESAEARRALRLMRLGIHDA